METIKLRPITRMIATIGELPTSYLISMTYEEQILWLCNYIETKVIPAINNNADAVVELQKAIEDIRKYCDDLKQYVDDYFDNLDLQEEIDKALDEMVESGKLAEIIAEYLQLGAILGFNNKDALQNAENLVEGSICRTLGENNYFDGYGHYYKIRLLESGDVIDNDKLVELLNLPTLVAEKIPDSEVDNILKDCFYEEITYTVNRDETTGTDYYLTSIPKFDNEGNLIKLYMDRVEEENGKYKPSNYARKNLTSFTSNASLAIKDLDDIYYNTLVIADGEIINPVHTFGFTLDDYYQYLCIDENRNITSYQANSTSPEVLLSAGVKQAFLVWYKCIANGSFVPRSIDVYNLTDDIRQMLGVKANGDIVFFTNDGRSSVNHGLTCEQACNILLANGVVNAWELDGGGSASTMVKTYKINRMYDANMTKERNIKFVLSAKKDTTYKNVGKAYATASRHLQQVNSQIMAYINAINNFNCFGFTDSTLTTDGYFTMPLRQLQSYGNSNITIDTNDNTKLKVLKSGYFIFDGILDGNYPVAGNKYVEVFVNNNQRYVSKFSASAGESTLIPILTSLTLDVGDVVEIKIEGNATDRLQRGRCIVKYYGI